MNPIRWVYRHLFFLLAVLGAAALFGLTLVANRFISLEPQAVLVEGDEIPGALCSSGPFYDIDGYAQSSSAVYSGAAPLYRLPAEALDVVPPQCDFPQFITPTLVTQLGAPFFPIRIEALTPGEWMRLGESTTLEARVSVEPTFPGARTLDLEAVPWKPEETRNVNFSISAPNFDFSPANDEIQPQPLSRDRPARQVWIIAPHGGVSGDQVINVKLDDPATGLPVTFAYVWLNVRHPSGLDPVIVTLVAAAGLAIGWVLDRIKTLYEIRKLVQSDPSQRVKPPGPPVAPAAPSPAETPPPPRTPEDH